MFSVLEARPTHTTTKGQTMTHTHYAPSIAEPRTLCTGETAEQNSYPVTCPDCRAALGWDGERRYGVDSLGYLIADGIV